MTARKTTPKKTPATKPAPRPAAVATPTGLTEILAARFAAHPERHAALHLTWSDVLVRLERSPAQLKSLAAMEATGGEPDVVGRDPDGAIVFVDCAAESPVGRRSLCYDGAALASRKENKPQGSALERARAMGVEVLDEEAYRALQQVGAFDQKTSSWVLTPAPIRDLGGALFCDRRYDQVFVYHNGADSYYGARGFRASLRV